MLTYEQATRDQRAEFLAMLRMEMAQYLDQIMKHTQMTWEQFVERYNSRGLVHAVYEDGKPAGYYWIELRGETLHLHGIVILPEFRGHGIGTRILRKLARDYASQAVALELGVKNENIRARQLYEREGFRAVNTLEEIGFTIMQRTLAAEDFRW